ncbi:helix-turn-helix domain-containing protein [Oscillibacter sp.]|uniref:helix-turn-helix domain-containing protein n=1 Tax=Oscillibacter sp. TaxID=1945593 RepID=UPI002609CD76|nr:helix-turn-helix domain-containing protein [Oscillibacter sp.]MDD3347514.1 helix-turn-helix domain-containing protein [Oscillibacter sp.]
MERQFRTIEFEDRKTIASMYEGGVRTADIADQIGVSRSTVYTELKRGQDGVTLDKNLRFKYDPVLAQKRVREGLRRRGRKKEENRNV